MTIDYDEGRIAEQYRQAKEQAWRGRIETYSFMKWIGDLRGKSVVDLACGAGHFTRRLRDAGAARIIGSDISERMIDMARDEEARDPLGIEYRVEDARTSMPQEQFDVAVSAWLLVYAHDREELGRMCRGIASRVRPGGRFVTFTTNPELYSFQPMPDYRKYGFEMSRADRTYEGAPILWKIHLDDSTLDIENYYLPASAYEEAFVAAGFRDFRVQRPELSPNPDGIDDRDEWAVLLDHPVAILMDCVKA